MFSVENLRIFDQIPQTMKPKATLKNISSMLGISISTVSRALSDHPDISNATKQKVRELAEMLDYEPNSYAVYLRTNASKVLGLIVPEISNNFYDSVISAIEEESRKIGYSLLILQSGNDPVIEQSGIRLCKYNRAAGIFIALSSTTQDMSPFQKLEENGIHMVFMDKIPEDDQFDRVTMNDNRSATLAAEALLARQPKRILALLGAREMSITRRREQAFTEYVKAHSQATIDIRYVPDRSSARTEAEKALFSGTRPDALFCMSDEVLTGAIKAVQHSGIRVPEELAIVSISNGYLPTLFHPEITYVETSGHALGLRAFESMMKHLNGQHGPTSVEVPVKLVAGRSL
jgi:LacI family transcriptional regulator